VESAPRERTAVTDAADLAGAVGVLATGAAVLVAGAARALHERGSLAHEDARGGALPAGIKAAAIAVLEPFAAWLGARGVTANGVTAVCLALGLVGGALLAFGHFGLAAFAVALASIGDGVDGRIARAKGTASPGGALFDASVDRYQEFAALGGLAFFFRDAPLSFAAALLAIVGSFMVSYGSAKAEGLQLPVPPGAMRRTERAALVAAGITLAPFTLALARARLLPAWLALAPVTSALVVLAIAANVSAVLRLVAVARAATGGGRPHPQAHSSGIPASVRPDHVADAARDATSGRARPPSA
jgi:CDP-diacylglycerol--glycerol-3-phosphate 3-phosphatidyltransferase